MKLGRTPLGGVAIGSVVLLSAVALAGCGSDKNNSKGGGPKQDTSAIKCEKGSLTSAGSTAQANAMAEWIKSYGTKCSGAQINYGGGGSGAGIQQFSAGTVDFAGSDSALKDTEQPAADARCKTGKAINLPMVPGPIAVVYNVSGVTSLNLKPATIAKIFAGKVKTWNDAAIKADNPGANLPGTPIQTFHRGDSSGTTDNFTSFLAATSAADWTFAHDKVWKAPGGQGSQGSDGVSASIKSTDGSIGYVEYSFAKNNALNMAKVANGSGDFVELTPDNVAKAVGAAKVIGTGNDLKLQLDYATTTKNAYPLLLVTYEIVCEKGTATDKLPLLKSFLDFAASAKGQETLTTLGYAPLPSDIATKVQDAIKSLS